MTTAPFRIPAGALLLALAITMPMAAQGAPTLATPTLATPLSLEQAIAQAKARSGSLKVKRLDIGRAGYAVKEAMTKALPSLGITGTSTYMTNPPKGIKIGQGDFSFSPAFGSEYPIAIPDQDYVLIKDTEPTYFKIQASLDQVLWTWGKIRKAVDLARLDEAAARVAATSEERSLVRDLSKAYFGVVLARDSLVELREAARIMAAMVEDGQSAFEVGTATKLDVLEASSRAAELSYQVVRAQESFQTGLDALEFYLGRRPAPEDLVTAFRDSLPGLDEKSLLESTLVASTEIENLSISAGKAKLARQIREVSIMGIPDFFLNVTYDLTGQEIPFFAGNWTDSWSGDLLITLGGKVTLFDSLASVWRLKEAQVQEEEANLGLAELKRSMGIQVRRLVEAARSGAALVVQTQAAADLSSERARNALLSFRNEAITRTQEGGARVADISARLALLLARYQTESALLDLEFSTGRAFSR